MGEVRNFIHPCSRSWQDQDDIEKVQSFFTQEKGSITVTEAICLTHRVDIADAVTKKLLNGFVESVKSLESFNNKTSKEKGAEFRRFVNEYGTHYQTTSILGTRIVIETRFSNIERSSANKSDLITCADLSGTQVLGIQLEYDKRNCSDGNLLKSRLNSDILERTKVSVHGSFLAKSLADWSQQVVSLVQEGKFTGVVIQRELSLISNLFTEDNFDAVKRDDGTDLDLPGLVDWFLPMLSNQYCSVFNISCDQQNCVTTDKCNLDEWCQYDFKQGLNALEDISLSTVREEFICTLRNISLELSTGNSYRGSTNRLNLPHGWGAELAGTDNTSDILYEGGWVDGRREGEGTIYHGDSSIPSYKGSMVKDQMSGSGVLYYSSGNEMFSGKFEMNTMKQGRLYKDQKEFELLGVLEENNRKEFVNRFQSIPEVNQYLPKPNQ